MKEMPKIILGICKLGWKWIYCKII